MQLRLASTLPAIIKSTVTILPIVIFSLIFSLYGIVAKRLRWIYWLNSLNNVIPVQRRSQIDWEGYSNVMGNIVSISGFILVLGWVVIEKLGKVNYFPILLLPYLILMIWGQWGYSFRRFDKKLYSDLQREKMRIKLLEYYNLDFVFTALSIILIGIDLLILK